MIINISVMAQLNILDSLKCIANVFTL